MITEITKERFHALFRYPPAPPGSFAALVREQTKETGWFEDTETSRLGVVVYDKQDHDWGIAVLEKQDGIYRACQAKTSIPAEAEAIKVLYQMLNSENDETQKALDAISAECFESTGRSYSEIFFQADVSKSNVTMGFAPCFDEEDQSRLMMVLAPRIEVLLEESYFAAVATASSDAAHLRETGRMIVHLSDDLHTELYHDGEEIGISCFLSLDPTSLVSKASMSIGPSKEIERHVVELHKTLKAYQEMAWSRN